LNVKSSHRISRRIHSSLILGVAYDGEVLFNVENEFKYFVRDHLKAYFGIRYSIDGWQYLFGMKIAGIKIKVPIINIDQSVDHHMDDKDVWYKFAGIIGIFLGGSYLARRYSNY
jgi:hypothetical protein